MSTESLVSLVSSAIAFTASVLATAVAIYNARFVRFAKERWWQRQDDAYRAVLGALVTLKHSLHRWEDAQNPRSQSELELKSSAEYQHRINDDFLVARNQIERAAIEGDYVLSKRSAHALSDLLEELDKRTQNWSDDLYDHLLATQKCLDILNQEAKANLRVK